MSTLLASAWLALRRMDETGDVTLFANHQKNAGRAATRGRLRVKPLRVKLWRRNEWGRANAAGE